MKHKTWFRLLIKAIGVVMVGLSLPLLFQLVVFVIFVQQTAQGGMPSGLGGAYWWLQVGHYSGGLVQAAIGLYLLFGGEWLVNTCIPSNRPYCPECGYDLSQSSAERCPECGVSMPRV